jgi:universal stress protein F
MYNNILVPISFDEDRDSNKAIKVAETLLNTGGTITLFHVMEQIPGYAISYMPTDYITESRSAIQTELETLAGSVKGGKALLVEGHSARTILDWADKHAVDCIIIASHRPGMQDLLLGSTATTVVRHAHCAVHVLR